MEKWCSHFDYLGLLLFAVWMSQNTKNYIHWKFGQSSLCEALFNMGNITFFKNESAFILMSKMECFVLYIFLVKIISKLYFHGTKGTTTLVVFKYLVKIKLWKLLTCVATGCLRGVEGHQMFINVHFGRH